MGGNKEGHYEREGQDLTGVVLDFLRVGEWMSQLFPFFRNEFCLLFH